MCRPLGLFDQLGNMVKVHTRSCVQRSGAHYKSTPSRGGALTQGPSERSIHGFLQARSTIPHFLLQDAPPPKPLGIGHLSPPVVMIRIGICARSEPRQAHGLGRAQSASGQALPWRP
jgi:hypothetical protein